MAKSLETMDSGPLFNSRESCGKGPVGCCGPQGQRWANWCRSQEGMFHEAHCMDELTETLKN